MNTAQEMLLSIRATLNARAEGRSEGGDIEIMQAVDKIVQREASEYSKSGDAPKGEKRPIARPCSACSAGDYRMEYHDHYPPFSDEPKSGDAPATRVKCPSCGTLDIIWNGERWPKAWSCSNRNCSEHKWHYWDAPAGTTCMHNVALNIHCNQCSFNSQWMNQQKMAAPSGTTPDVLDALERLIGACQYVEVGEVAISPEQWNSRLNNARKALSAARASSVPPDRLCKCICNLCVSGTHCMDEMIGCNYWPSPPAGQGRGE